VKRLLYIEQMSKNSVESLLETTYISKEELLWWSLQCPSNWDLAVQSVKKSSNEHCPECDSSGFWSSEEINDSVWECFTCHYRTTHPVKKQRRSPRKQKETIDSLAFCGPMKVHNDFFADPREIGDTLCDWIDERGK